jgi:hypothetical protein
VRTMKTVNESDGPVAVLYWLIGGPGPREAELADGRLKPWHRASLLPTTEEALQSMLRYATHTAIQGHQVLDGVALRVGPEQLFTDDVFPPMLTAEELDARVRSWPRTSPPNA